MSEENEVLYPETQHTEAIQDIITSIPAWIIRWGITLIFAILAGIVLLAALIEYPDIVKTKLTVNSLNSPKSILARQTGKIIKLLVSDQEIVAKGDPLAYLESTANPEDILKLSSLLKQLQANLSTGVDDLEWIHNQMNLGEMQASYQNFYEHFLSFQSTQRNGYYLNKIKILEKDLNNIKLLRSELIKQQEIQNMEFANQETEYKTFQLLFKKKIISLSEFREHENKYFASKYPLQQTRAAVLNNEVTYNAKEKELLDLKQTISVEKANFTQTLKQCIAECNSWIRLYILTSPISGKVSYAGIVQENQNVVENQQVFIVSPENTTFFGEIELPQYNMGKVRIGQPAIVKLTSYPFEQYGVIRGELSGLSDAAFRDSIFVGKITFLHFENKEKNNRITLKNGMKAEVEIVTEDSSLLERFFRNITKMMNSQ